MKHARLLVSIVYLAIQGTACNLALVQAMNAAHTPVHVQMATPFHKQREPLMINANRVTRDTRYTTKLKNALSTFVHAATASQRLGMSRTNVQAEVQMFAFHAMSDMLSPPTTHVSQKSHSVNNRRMVWLHIMTVEMPRVSAKQDTAAIPCSAMACGRPAAKRIIALAPMVLAHEVKHARLLVSIVYLAIQGTACNLALVQAMNAAHTPVHVQMATPFHKQRE